MTNYYNNIFKKIENCKANNYMNIIAHSQFVSKIFGKIYQKITSVYFFSSPGPWSRWSKVQVIYCHHLASVVCCLLSVVCKLFTFQASSPKPLGRLEPNLAGMFLGWSSTKLLFFVPVGYSIWLPGLIICSDWLKFQRSSSLKLMNWLNPNCKWMIIGMSFTKFLFFMPIRNPRWPSSQDID
jgi:hypothetical protein